MTHERQLVRGGALNLIGAAGASVAGLAVVVIVTRVYPQPVAGAFFAAISLFIIGGAICGLGTDVGLLRWLPKQLALGDEAAARRTVPLAVIPVAALAGLAAAALAVAAPWLSDAIGAGNAGPNMLRVLAAFLPIATVNDALLAATRGHGTMRPTVLIDKIARQGTQVIGLVIVSQVSEHPVPLALAWALPYLGALIVTAAWYRRMRPPAPAGSSGEGGDATADLAGAFWRYTAPRALAQICQTTLQRVDIVLLAALGSARDAAIYTAATRFIVVGQLAAVAIQQVMQPTVSRLLALSDRSGAHRVYAVSTTWTVALTWPVHLCAAVGAPVYLAVFGTGYAGDGETATVILALTMLLATACGPVDVMLLMAGRSGLSLANNAGALAVNLALNLVLIPSYGVTGAAIAWSAAIVTRNLLPLLQVHRLLGMAPVGAGLGRACAAAVLALGMLPFLLRLSSGTIIPGLAAGAVLYAGLLWIWRDRLALSAFTDLLPQRKVHA